jgi:manganese-dependent inorganic pyrophosphatase
MQDLGTSILELASDVSDRSAQQLLTADFKDFNTDGAHFGIGVIETTNGNDVLARRDELLAEMTRLRERGYTSILFAVIDILREQTTILVTGYPDAVAAAFDVPLQDGHAIRLPGILSRKKQIVPLLGAISRLIER